MRKCRKEMKHKHNIKPFINARTDLVYIKDPEPGYSQTNYVTREDLPEVPHDKFTHLIQSTMGNEERGGRREHTPDTKGTMKASDF